jgi:hypothetical protein
MDKSLQIHKTWDCTCRSASNPLLWIPRNLSLQSVGHTHPTFYFPWQRRLWCFNPGFKQLEAKWIEVIWLAPEFLEKQKPQIRLPAMIHLPGGATEQLLRKWTSYKCRWCFFPQTNLETPAGNSSLLQKCYFWQLTLPKNALPQKTSLKDSSLSFFWDHMVDFYW